MPRVLPADVALLLDGLPENPRGFKGFRSEVARRVQDASDVTPADARILGRAYDKQVDVCISRWKTGPELLISTKTQVSSFGKNLPNRFEEALGDAANLRERHPLAATGYLFVQRSTIRDDEPDAWERSKDMVRKLRETTETRATPRRASYSSPGKTTRRNLWSWLRTTPFRRTFKPGSSYAASSSRFSP